ncbi:MAG: 50S ribosomal protein L24 [Candidatus Gracilibacteria bacterium]|nr:50S ribosomal protein L24 [Candidatus Gracilibacteria bacterium]
MKIKEGDQVVVITGKSKGKTGEVLKINKKTNKILVKDVNMHTKHIKKSANGPGQKIQRETPIDVSNLMVICPKTNKPSRVGYRILKDGKKERFAKKSGEALS